MAKIICIKKENLIKLGYNDLEDWLNKDKNHIYIGRDMSFYVKGATKSKWHNPFTIKQHGKDKCLELYKEYMTSNKELMLQLFELKGKTLGCWCSNQEECHGGILMNLLEKID